MAKGSAKDIPILFLGVLAEIIILLYFHIEAYSNLLPSLLFLPQPNCNLELFKPQSE